MKLNRFFLIFLLILSTLAVADAASWTRPNYWFDNGSIVNVSIPRNIDITPRNLTADTLISETILDKTDGIEWIKPEHISDVDDEDIETDLNTYWDIGGDSDSGSSLFSFPNSNLSVALLDGNLSCTNITGATSDLCTVVDTTIDNCSVAGSCSDVVYMDYANQGDFNINGTSTNLVMINSNVTIDEDYFKYRSWKPVIWFDDLSETDAYIVVNTHNFGISTDNTLANSKLMVEMDTGNVGIGTTTPSHELNVVGDANVTGNYYGDGSQLTGLPIDNCSVAGSCDDVAYMDYANTGDLNVSGYGLFTQNLIVDGNVGIGTNNPTTELDIDDGGGVTGSSYISFNDRVQVGYDIFGTGQAGLILQGGSGKGINFRTNDIERMTLNSAGNLGIGTTTPGEELQVIGDISLNVFSAGSTVDRRIGIGTVTTGALTLHWGGIKFTEDIGNNQELHFFTSSAGGASTEKLTILKDGEVGIGTTTPSSELHVVGDANVTGKLSASNFWTTSTETPTNDVHVGYDACDDHSAGNNVCIGTRAGRDHDTTGLVAVGYQAGVLCGNAGADYYDCTNSFALGSGALYSGGVGSIALGGGAGAGGNYQEIAIGRNVFAYDRSRRNDYNIGIGQYIAAGSSSSTYGDYNVVIGSNSARMGLGHRNLLLGYSSAYGTNYTNRILDDNICLGYESCKLNEGSRNIVLGKGADVTGDDNFLVESTGQTLLSGNFANPELVVHGDLNVTGNVTVEDEIHVTNKVGIGTSSPSVPLHIYNGDSGATPSANVRLVIEDDDVIEMTILSPNTTQSVLAFGDEQNPLSGGFAYNHVTDTMNFISGTATKFAITPTLSTLLTPLTLTSTLNVSTSVQAGNYYSGDGSQGVTDAASYWFCTDPTCSSTCQVDIKDGLIVGCGVGS